MRALPMAFAMLAAGTLAAEPPDGRVTENVVLVTLDGVRIQDFFGGLDDAVAAHDATQLYSDIGAMRERYGAATAAERRARLMPELWTRLLPQGMAFGNVAHGNHVKVRNGVYWSTPGYVEMLTGAPRREVRDNDFRRYPYPTALDLAREAPGMSFGQVAQFGSWDGFALAASRSDEGFLMLGAYDDLPAELGTPGVAALNEIRREVMGLWEEGSNDMLTYRMAKAYVQQHRPRVLWLAFVNSDDWAHADRYDRYLEYLHRADAMLGDLWTTLQSEDAYRDRTTLVVTTDHGRGLGAGWAEHDASIPGSDDIWLAVIGPDTPDVGEVTAPGTVYQGQVAATLLQFLGLDYRELGSDAMPPVAGTLAPSARGAPR